MPIEVITGRAGACKTAMLCQRLEKVCKRNLKFFEKSGIIRPIYCNFPVSKEFENTYKKFLRFLDNEHFVQKMVDLEDCDIFIDELLYHFDAQGWKELGMGPKRFLAIHRHLGIEIYATSQDFAQVDISFRRLTDKLYFLSKLFSSRVPSPTRPPVKRIFGCSVIYTIPPTDYKEDQKENKAKFHWLFWLSRRKCEIYDTRQKYAPGKPLPKKHMVLECEMGDKCSEHFGKVIHV